MKGARATTAVLYGILGLGAVAWIAAQGRGLRLAHPAPWIRLPEPLAGVASTGVGLAVAIAVVLASRILVRRSRWGEQMHLELRELLGGVSERDVAFLAVASGFAEELLFRGAMLPAWGLLWSSLVFGAAHPPLRPQLIPWTVWAGVMGLVFGALYAAFGSLLGPVVAHAGINYWNLLFLLRHDPSSARRYPG